MLALAVLIGETVALGNFPDILGTAIIFSLLVPIFSEMASFSLNDYLDMETDRINNRKRPLITGAISPKFAVYFSALAFIVSTLLAFFINMPAFLLVVVFNILAVFYNWKLKDLPLIGNIYIGLTMAIPFLFGNLVVHPQWLLPVPLALALMAFIAGVAREIVKSVQDMKGDIAGRRSKTLPVVIGEKQSISIACILYALFVPLSFSPFLLGLNPNIISLSMIAVADGVMLGLILSLLRSPSPKTYKTARNATLIIFATGMIAVLYASLSI